MPVLSSRELAIDTIDDRLYGSFIEHLGKTVTEDYEQGTPADEQGFAAAC